MKLKPSSVPAIYRQALVAMMTKFDEVKSIHERAEEAQDANVLREIPPMLNRWGIKCREKDG